MRIKFQLLACAILFFLAAAIPSVAEPRRVRVGINLPLSGDLAVFGDPIQNGFSMAVQEIQLLEPPVNIEVDWQDNQGKATQAASIGASQLAKPLDIYVSGLKPQTLSIVERISAIGVPHFIWAWDNRIDQVATNTLRTWLNFGLEASAIQAYAQQRRPSRVAILYVQIPGNTETHYRSVVATSLKASGATDVMLESYSLDDVDLRPLILKLKKHNPDLIIVNGFPHQLINIVHALRQLRMIRNGNTFASMDILDAASALSAQDLEGLVTAAPKFMLKDFVGYKNWAKNFESKLNKPATYHAAFAYDQAYAIYDAAIRLPPNANSSEWRTALLSTNRKGVTGDVRFDQNGSLEVEAVPATYSGGQLIEVTTKNAPDNKAEHLSRD